MLSSGSLIRALGAGESAMLFTPKHVPLNWYKYDAQFSIELLREYISGVERHIVEAIEVFHREKETHVFEESAEEGYARIVEMHRDLDDETWDLEGIFEGYFPDLQRRSALITLYSFLEHELEELCGLFIRDENLKVSLNDMRGTGIERALLFLEKIVGLQIDKGTATWQEVKNIQKVRNLVVHNDAKLKDRSGNPKADVIKYVEGSVYLSGDEEINILDGYLLHVLETFDRQFQEIDKLVVARAST
jgi:hypothetical protein